MNGAIPRLRPYAFMLAQRQSFFSGFYGHSLNECGFISNELRVSVIEVGSLNPSRVTGISLRSPPSWPIGLLGFSWCPVWCAR